MADYDINAITRRVVFSGSAGLGPYAFAFEILNENDIAVYFNATKLTITTDYTVTVNENGTGSATIVTGGSVPSTPTASDTITIVGARDIERTTDFVTAGDLRAAALNEQLDGQIIMTQQLAEENKRSLSAPVTDPAHVDDGGTLDMTLPAKADRAGRYLQFNSTTGNPEAGPDGTDVTALADIASDIATLADIQDGTVATNAITTASSISGNITTVAGIAANVTTTAANITAINTNADNITDIQNASANAAAAASSATDAETAQTAAEAAQAAAEATLDSFDDRYLGSKASAPTVDNDGDPLTEGVLYWNSTSNTLFVFDGSVWTSANPDLVNDSTPQLGGNLDLNGNDITGTGDINITGSITASPNFSWNASTQRLGLGLTTPDTLLHLQSASPTIRFTDTDDSAHYGNIGYTENSVFVIESDVTNVDPGSGIQFKVDSSLRMTIDSSGADITGVLTTDGLTVAGNVSVDGGTIKLDGNYPIGTNNVAMGDNALSSVTASGTNNVAIGSDALQSNASGGSNVAIGTSVLDSNLTGFSNVAIGYAAMGDNTTGSRNVAMGFGSLINNVSAADNVGIGYFSLYTNTTGASNVAIGQRALYTSNTSNNTAVGHNAGRYITTGEKNTILGNYDGNQGGLDIRTSSNHIVLSDGDGNPRLYIDNNGNTTVSGTVDGRDLAADGSKLDGIEAGATADQTKADIDALNIDADTLDGQHGSYYTNYTDTAISNLVDTAPATLDTLNELAAALGDDANFSTTVTNSIATKVSKSGDTMTGNLTLNGGNIVMTATETVDGRDLSVDGAKLDGIEAGATADQTASEIKTAYESNSDTNALTDALLSKLNGIEANATADQSASEILASIKTVDGAASGLDADLLDGQHGSHYLDYGNFTNTPTIPTNNNELTNGAGYITGNQTITLSGDVSGSGTTSIAVTVADDSHTHDGRYYTETEIDNRMAYTLFDTNALTSSDDLDSITANGWYRWSGSAPSNTPSGTYHNMIVIYDGAQPTQMVWGGSGAGTADIHIRRRDSGTWQPWTKFWNTGNDGSGSGLDADTVDGIQASSFVRSDADDTKTGSLNIGAAIGSRANTLSIEGDSDSSPFAAKVSSNATVFSILPYSSGQTYIGSGVYFDDGSWVHASDNTNNCLLALRGDGVGWYSSDNSTGSWNVASNVSLWNASGQWNGQLSTNVTYNGNTIWHSGNDGSGSGLDADTVDGVEESSFMRKTAQTSLVHEGDTDTYISFGTNTHNFYVGGSNKMIVNASGVQLGDTGNGYFRPVSGSYGSIEIDGGAHNSWEGYSIGGRAVFMHDNSTQMGLYDDVNNHWVLNHVLNGGTTLYYDGTAKLDTDSLGIDVSGSIDMTGRIQSTGTYHGWRIGNYYGTVGFVTLSSPSSSGAGISLIQSGSAPSVVPNQNQSLFNGTDNVIDLGNSSKRWDDIYATNGTIQTSDVNLKEQIAPLTPAEIEAATAISKLFRTYKWRDKVEAKGDAARTHTGVVAQAVEVAMTAAGLDASKYAFFISTDWWEADVEYPAIEAVDEVRDENGNVVTPAVEGQEAASVPTVFYSEEEAPEGAVKHNRKGIRYPELLAFIGAATEQRLSNIEARLDVLEAN